MIAPASLRGQATGAAAHTGNMPALPSSRLQARRDKRGHWDRATNCDETIFQLPRNRLGSSFLLLPPVRPAPRLPGDGDLGASLPVAGVVSFRAEHPHV